MYVITQILLNKRWLKIYSSAPDEIYIVIEYIGGGELFDYALDRYNTLVPLLLIIDC